MRLRSSLTIIMTAMLTALLALDGCVTEPATEVTPARKAFIELMQKVPVYYEDFEFWDAITLREDSDLAEMYQMWYERKVEVLERKYGIQGAGIDYLAQGEGLLKVIKADYDVGALRDRISLDFYRDSSYEDIEVWKSQPSSNPQSVSGGWVLAEGLLVRGSNNSNVDDYLRVVGGEELSMYDKNAAGLLERLPEGIMIRITRSSGPEGVIIYGSAIKKEEKGTYSWVNEYQFESSEAAQGADASEYFKGLEDDFNEAANVFTARGAPCPFWSFTLTQEGKFVKWSVQVEELYMIGLLFYG